MSRQPTARLLSTTAFPVQTMYCLWMSSRGNDLIQDPSDLAADMAESESCRQHVMQTFGEIVASDIPVSENMDFVFLLEDVPVSLREQIVRHRIGHRFGENFGVDIVPGSVQDSWWSQSMRILDMGTFAAEERYFTPDTIGSQTVPELCDPVHPDASTMTTARELYQDFMVKCQEVYNAFVEAGIPREDARQVIPLAATSRITWKMNFMSIKHILRRRTCWIAQLGMWEGIIHGMINELAEKIHPVFRSLGQPPCFNTKGEWAGCPFPGDNHERIRGKDEIPPCPLYLTHHRSNIEEAVPNSQRTYHQISTDPLMWVAKDPQRDERFRQMQVAYRRLWGRDVWTGTVIA